MSVTESPPNASGWARRAREGALDRLRTWASLGAPESSWWARAASVSLVVLGGVWFFIGFIPFVVVAVLPLLAAMRLAASLVLAHRRLWRAVGWVSAAGLVAGNLFGLVVMATFGTTLAWTVPVGIRVLTASLVLLAALGPRLTLGVRVPLALPMGIWAGACFGGWEHEEGLVRCDDYARIRPPVEIVVPTRRDFGACRPGMSLPLGRSPRHLWEAPDASRYVFTSQTSKSSSDLQPADVITGLLCETPPAGTVEPRCIGGASGKSQGIRDAPPLNKLFIGAWAGIHPAGGARTGGLVMTVPRAGPLEPIEQYSLQGTVGADFLYQPAHDTLWVFSEDFTTELRRASDFTLLEGGTMSVMMLDARVDPATDEGIVCGFIYTPGEPIATIAAFHGSPPARRDIVSTSLRWPLVVGVPFGCEFDPKDRKVYASLTNLGMVVRFDYDSGRVEKLFPLGVGVRALTYDPARRWLYVVNFSGGELAAVEVDSGVERERWFVGRFARDVRLTRDGHALLVASNVGLVRIALDRPIK